MQSENEQASGSEFECILLDSYSVIAVSVKSNILLERSSYIIQLICIIITT